MRREGHGIRLANHRTIRPVFEKTTNNVCPNCGDTGLAVYFKSDTQRRIGALCYSCGLVGFFADDSFFELGRIPKTHGHVLPRRVFKQAGG